MTATSSKVHVTVSSWSYPSPSSRRSQAPDGSARRARSHRNESHRHVGQVEIARPRTPARCVRFGLAHPHHELEGPLSPPAFSTRTATGLPPWKAIEASSGSTMIVTSTSVAAAVAIVEGDDGVVGTGRAGDGAAQRSSHGTSHGLPASVIPSGSPVAVTLTDVESMSSTARLIGAMASLYWTVCSAGVAVPTWWIVDRCHLDGDGGLVRVELPVVGHVGEGVGADPVEIRRVAERSSRR